MTRVFLPFGRRKSAACMRMRASDEAAAGPVMAPSGELGAASAPSVRPGPALPAGTNTHSCFCVSKT